MANLPSLPPVRRMTHTDYKDAPPWFAKHIENLNKFLTPVRDFLANVPSRQIESFTLTTAGTLGDTFGNKLRFQNRLPTTPKSVVIGRINQTSPAATITYAVGPVDWTLTPDGFILVNYIPGLSVSTQYSVTLVIE